MSITAILQDLRRVGYTVHPTKYSRVFIGGIASGAERIYRPIMIDNPDAVYAMDGSNERTTWFTTREACRDLIDDAYVIGYFGEDAAAAMGVTIPNPHDIPATEQTIYLPGLDVMLTVNQDGTIAVELFTRNDFDPAWVTVTLDDGELTP